MACVEYGGYVYIAGGNGGENRFDRYDPVSDTWERLPDIPTPRYELSGAASNGCVFAVGGMHNERE